MCNGLQSMGCSIHFLCIHFRRFSLNWRGGGIQKVALKNIDMNIGDVNVIETSALSYAPNIFCAFFGCQEWNLCPLFLWEGI